MTQILILVLAALAAGLLGAALILIFGRRGEGLAGRIGHYTVSEPVAIEHLSAGPVDPETTLKQRVMRVTSSMANRAGLLVKVDELLERANLPLRAAEACFFYAAGLSLVGLLSLLTAPTPLVGLGTVLFAAMAPVAVLKSRVRKRLKAFEAQLPDTLNLLAGTLRAGYSFLQGMEAVAQETSEPMATELRRVLAEARLGRPMEQALEDAARRMQSTDFEWAVMAVGIQREVGGNLAELLGTVADTMLQRGRLKGEIRTLTAEGRISAVVMALLPLGLGAFMSVANPEYIATLFSSWKTWSMVSAAVALAFAGFAWINKIVKIEV